mgnify:CR=1 FL=1
MQITTVYLLDLNGRLPAHFDAAVFADTGDEPAAVYRHLDWLRSLGGPPIIVRTAGKLGDDLIAGRNSTGQRFVSIPAYTAPDGSHEAVGQMKRQCSKEYKVEVVERTIRREILGLKPRARWPRGIVVDHYFGISLEEARRTIGIRKRVLPPRQRPHFPLVDELRWTRGDCVRWLERRVPHQVPRSACVFCPYRSDAEFLRLKETDAGGWHRAVEVDEAVRTQDLSKKFKQKIYIHPTARPLATVILRGEGQGVFPNFVQECEGVCGV